MRYVAALYILSSLYHNAAEISIEKWWDLYFCGFFTRELLIRYQNSTKAIIVICPLYKMLISFIAVSRLHRSAVFRGGHCDRKCLLFVKLYQLLKISVYLLLQAVYLGAFAAHQLIVGVDLLAGYLFGQQVDTRL